ncbi:MAG: hypothetical protein ACOX9B_06080 [Candidatus Xenobium sp.]|jgi:hypothetical protein|nr:hypothetical protein [Burkholderiales bacterium]
MHRHRRLPLLARLGAGIRGWFSILVLLGALGVAGCASGPSENSVAGGSSGPRFLHFTVTVNPNGVIDRTGQGYYAILINAQGEPIEVTNLDTFTDFIRFDGNNVDWFHRQANMPNPGFTFTQAGSLNAASSVSADRRQWRLVLDVGESTSFLNQFVVANRFTAHLVTTDNYQNSILGRVLDTMGPGPGLASNAQQTLHIQKGMGAVSPLPSYYPDDPLNDWITRDDLPPTLPYTNFDIAKFEVVSQSE